MGTICSHWFLPIDNIYIVYVSTLKKLPTFGFYQDFFFLILTFFFLNIFQECQILRCFEVSIALILQFYYHCPQCHCDIRSPKFCSFISAIGHKCYVCKPNRLSAENRHELESTLGDRSIESLHNCKDYHRLRNHHYLIECPTGSSGCLTKFEGE